MGDGLRQQKLAFPTAPARSRKRRAGAWESASVQGTPLPLPDEMCLVKCTPKRKAASGEAGSTPPSPPSPPELADTAFAQSKRVRATGKSTHPNTQGTHHDHNKRKLRQLHLDVGQRHFDTTTCAQCGVMYAVGVEEDESVHGEAHAVWERGVAFQGWNNERVLRTQGDTRVVLVDNASPPVHWSKVDAVLVRMRTDLGDKELPCDRSKLRVFLGVQRKRVVACCIAEPVCEAFHLDRDQDGNGCASEGALLLDKSRGATKSVECGVSHIWVIAGCRRQGLASLLVDSVRANFRADRLCLRKDQVAMSQPTREGAAFARRYFGDDFAVYV